jgi:hypothetical protein
MAGKLSTSVFALALTAEDPRTLLRSMQIAETERKENEKAIQEQNIKIQQKLLSKSTKHFEKPTKHAQEKFSTPTHHSRRRG